MKFSNMWRSNFFKEHKIFEYIEKIFSENIKRYNKWPEVSQYKELMSDIRLSKNILKDYIIQDVNLNNKNFEEGYEQTIFLKGKVPTREYNWHDFFNALVWQMFPKTKSLLNEFQYKNLLHRFKNSIPKRTNCENILTQFDECGIIIIMPKTKVSYSLKQDLKSFNWSKMFLDRRAEVKKNMHFITFGHAIYEKALNPYIGLSAKAIFIDVEIDLYEELTNDHAKIEIVDSLAFEKIKNLNFSKKLQPIPILGIPGWHQCQDVEFYLNKDYFRDRPQDIDFA